MERVLVAFRGENVSIKAGLQIPANWSQGTLTCSDPSNRQIYSCNIDATENQPANHDLNLELKNLTSSGEYWCQYYTAKVYWFLQLRDEGYVELLTWNHTELIGAVFTGVLLVFSAISSVYVFRGNWKEHIADCRKHKQNEEEREAKEMQEDNVEDVRAPSASVYASLEHRPRSIYDVLDHSAVKGEPDQSKAKIKKKELKEMKKHTEENQPEGVFECVYENF
ncbi:uncharacterized protein si:ch211-243a20.4 isoform X2 [Notolabrus celidotus]|nr:uncharacterized protein si:ch211-243a20.4 isoform X2 [Notolabrus celidotus]XP_034542785.1 uncharacterized protein si:ch211-243a20.4 isoform X2 [Notolabrus celidotus]